MPSRLLPFAILIDRLAQLYGEPAPPTVTEPFAMILWENVAYLVSDEKRSDAFAELQAKVGLAPSDIRKAKENVMLAISFYAHTDRSSASDFASLREMSAANALSTSAKPPSRFSESR
jgi:hypothetical protein